MPKLDKRERTILENLKKYIYTNGYSPTIHEIAEKVDISSTSLVSYYLNRLEEKGLISRESTGSRVLKLSVQGNEQELEVSEVETLLIPILGILSSGLRMPRPSPGVPFLSDANLVLNDSLVAQRTRGLFALQVADDSFLDVLLAEGDMVIFRYAERSEAGRLTAVWIESEQRTYLGRLYHEGTQVRLQPTNPTSDPRSWTLSEVHICAVVVLVLRSYEKRSILAQRPDFDLVFPSEVFVWVIDHPHTKPLEIGRQYKLAVGIVPETDQSVVSPFACAQYSVVLNVENAEIKSSRFSSMRMQDRMARTEFEIVPSDVGVVVFHINLYLQNTWRRELSLEMLAAKPSDIELVDYGS
jgi:repressor LexA